jgi:hypothetical protein
MNRHSSTKAAGKFDRGRTSQASFKSFLLAAAVLATLTVLPTAGCGRGGQGEVTGTITLKGAPLDQGTIQFVRDTDPPQAAGGSAIRAGQYKIPGSAGLAPGRYKVLITSPEIVGNQGQGDPMMSEKPVNKERIPSEFNAESQTYVEVRADGANQFNFAIP